MCAKNILILAYTALVAVLPQHAVHDAAAAATMTRSGGPALVLPPTDVSQVPPLSSVLPGILVPKKYASVSVVGVVGQSVHLPCNITVTTGDTVLIVLWFREGLATPIYSYDLREATGPLHWHDESWLGDRAVFKNDSTTPYLLLGRLTTKDAGLYKCRVDFQRAPTTNSRVNLTIVVPPSSVVLQDEEGLSVQSVIGPVMESSNLRLSCLAKGGSPPPTLEWTLRGQPVTSAHQTRTDDVTISHVVLKNVSRDLVMAKVACRAHTASVTSPVTASASIDMNLRPLEVVISEPVEPFSAGRTYDLMCTSRGSRPPAMLTWWRGTQRLRPIADQTWQEGNVSRSVLRLAVNSSLHQQRVLCRAQNPNVPDASVQDVLELSVYYLPKVSIGLGASLDPDHIREGDDVYFECNVNSNPPAYKVTWQHEGQDVRQNRERGVLVTQNSLVLQHVSRRHSGAYTCRASNVEGDSTSKHTQLDIHYTPVCRDGLVTTYGVASGETARVRCAVDGVPPVHRFYWVFNNTAESLSVPEGAFSKATDGYSILDYTPTHDFEYGTLQCLASNAVGKQLEPCVFQIVPAAKPQSPSECKLSNVTPSSLSLSCTAGFSGGLPQVFFLEVYSLDPRVLQANLSSKEPKFTVPGLEGGTALQLVVYSGNSRGRSNSVARLHVDLPSLPVKQLETRHDTEGNSDLLHVGSERQDPQRPVNINYLSLLGAFAGTITALAVIAMVAALSFKKRCCHIRSPLSDQEDKLTDSQTYIPQSQNTSETSTKTGEKLMSNHHSDISASQLRLTSGSAAQGSQGDIVTNKRIKKEESSPSGSIKCSVMSLTTLPKDVSSIEGTDRAVEDVPCVPSSGRKVQLAPSCQPLFSNHSFVYDEKGLSVIDRRIRTTTPPEPAPPDPFLQLGQEFHHPLSFSSLSVQKPKRVQINLGNTLVTKSKMNSVRASCEYAPTSKYERGLNHHVLLQHSLSNTNEPLSGVEEHKTDEQTKDSRRESSV